MNPLHPWWWNNDQENTYFSQHLQQARHVSNSSAHSRKTWRSHVGSNSTSPLSSHRATRGDSSFCNLVSKLSIHKGAIYSNGSKAMGGLFCTIPRKHNNEYAKSSNLVSWPYYKTIRINTPVITHLFVRTSHRWVYKGGCGLPKLLSKSGGGRVKVLYWMPRIASSNSNSDRDVYKGMICYLLEVATVRRKTPRDLLFVKPRKLPASSPLHSL